MITCKILQFAITGLIHSFEHYYEYPEERGGAQPQGGTSGNSINGVGPTNPKNQQYEDSANKVFITRK